METVILKMSIVRSLKSFREDYPESTQLLLYRGREKLKIDGILCVPVEGFLLRLTPGKEPILSE